VDGDTRDPEHGSTEETLVSYTANYGRGTPVDRVEEVLLAHDESLDEPVDVTYAVERLLERGLLYEAGGEIRITDPER
jgi:hypothetical protein